MDPIRLYKKEKEVSNEVASTIEPIRLWEKKESKQFGEFLEYPGWKKLEDEGKMTQTMWKMKEVGFMPPREATKKIEIKKKDVLGDQEVMELNKGISSKTSTAAMSNKLSPIGEVTDVAMRIGESSILNVTNAFWTLTRATFEPREKSSYFIDGKEFEFEGKIGELDNKINSFLEDNIKKPVSDYSIKVIGLLDERQQKIAAPLYDDNPNLSNWKEYSFVMGSGLVSLSVQPQLFQPYWTLTFTRLIFNTLTNCQFKPHRTL